MAFKSISRRTLELLHQSLRTQGVATLGVPPGRGSATTPSDPSYAVSDDFIRALPFVRVDDGPFARQYMLQTTQPLTEPEMSTRGGGTVWTPGTTKAFGEELQPTGARFKKVGVTVRVDELMAADRNRDVLDVQVNLAKVAIIRALSEAIFQSNPATDDDAELAGLPFFLAAGGDQDIDYASPRGMIGGLSELEARCHPGDDGLGTGADVFVMSSRAQWRLTKELEDKGLQPDYRHCDWVGRTCLHFHGRPVLGGRVPEPAGSPAFTEAWALSLQGPTGVRLLHLEGDEFGTREEPATTMADIDSGGEVSSASRGIEVFGNYALLVPEPQSIARLGRIPAEDPFTRP